MFWFLNSHSSHKTIALPLFVLVLKAQLIAVQISLVIIFYVESHYAVSDVV